MAKSQQKSNKEIRKPKANKEPKPNASNPSIKGKLADNALAKKRLLPFDDRIVSITPSAMRK